MNLRRIRALIWKEFLQIRRDPSSILIGIVMPLLYLFLYGFGLSLDMNNLPIGLLLEDRSPLATDFAASLWGSRYFDVEVAESRDDLDRLITRGKIRGFVQIPPWFTNYAMRPETSGPIYVVADGATPNTAQFVQNYVTGAWNLWRDPKREIALESRFWYNEELRSRSFIIPGSLAIIMALIGTLLTALVVAREWERGTMEALMSTPVHIIEILIGKLVPYFLFAMASMALCVVIATLLYQIPFRGSFWVLALVTATFLTTALSLGLLISTLTRNQFVAAQMSQVTAFLPAFMLSGFIFEISSMPQPIQWLTYLLPPRYFVSSLQTLFLVGDVWPLLIGNLLPMLLFSAALLTIISRITVKRLD